MKRDFIDLAHIGLIGFGGFTTAKLAQFREELQAWVLLLTLLGLLGKGGVIVWRWWRSKDSCRRCPHHGKGWAGCRLCELRSA